MSEALPAGPQATGGGPRRVASPRRVRELLERIGPTFIKVGQFLALRPDLIAQEYCDEFLKLTDQVPGFPFAVARRIIEEDLGRPVEELFATINPQPLAAASLAQVHLARTHDGHEVAVKVQREGIREAVERDLGRVRVLARVLEMAGAGALISPREVAAELRRWLHDEVDFGRELRNLERLWELSRQTPRARIPRPYPELSGSRVVTSEYLPGVPFSELLRYLQTGRPERIAALGYDREKLAENLLDTVLAQIFRCQFFHADTHPGNLLAMTGDRVGFVDFGLADTLDPTFRQGMLRYLSALYSDDLEGMFHGLTELLVATGDTDLERFRADFNEESRFWIRERYGADRGTPEAHSPVASYMVGVLRAARRNSLRVPAAVLSMYRALLTAETLASRLGGRVDLGSVGQRFFGELQLRRLFETADPRNLQPLAIQLLDLFQEGPGQVQRLLKDLAEGRFALRVRAVESEEDRRQANNRAGLIAASALSVGTAFLIGASEGVTLFGSFKLSWLLWGVLAATWVWVVVFWRRLS